MNTAAMITVRAASLAAATALTAFALAACANPSTTASAPTASSIAPSPTPTPTVVSELPEWAQTGSVWLVYPDGFECQGTEGCPNDFRALIGEPSDPLPDGVEMYDPERHDGRMVWPREQSPVMDEGNTQRLDGDKSGSLPPLDH